MREVSLKRELVGDPDTYPFNIPAVRHLDALEFHPDVTFFVPLACPGAKIVLFDATGIKQLLSDAKEDE